MSFKHSLNLHFSFYVRDEKLSYVLGCIYISFSENFLFSAFELGFGSFAYE